MSNTESISALTWLRAQWDRVAGYACIATGAGCMIVGAVQISRSPSILSQLSYIGSAALIGLFLTIVGVGLLVTADLHDEWRKLDRIEAAIRATGPSPVAPATSVAGAPGSTLEPGSVFWRHAPSTALRPAPVLLAVVGAVGLAAGFLRTSRTLDLDHAFQGVAVSVTGFVALALAAAVVVVSLRREVGLRMVGALGGWSTAAVVLPESSWVPAPAAPAPGSDDAVLLVPELRRYHRPSCPAVAGLDTVSLDRAHLGPGMRPCGICDAAGQWAPAEVAR
jgi:hypothetical protein